MRAARLMWIPALALIGQACAPEYEHVELAGRDGILRFNLEFDHNDEVDLDLRITTPNGNVIDYVVNAVADGAETEEEQASLRVVDGGQLDVDCFCDYDIWDDDGNEVEVEACADGPNENIYWDYAGEAPEGEYLIEVHYYGVCDETALTGPPTSYTLRILQAGQIVQTYMGTLDSIDDVDEYVHVQGVTE